MGPQHLAERPCPRNWGFGGSRVDLPAYQLCEREAPFARVSFSVGKCKCAGCRLAVLHQKFFFPSPVTPRVDFRYGTSFQHSSLCIPFSGRGIMAARTAIMCQYFLV